MLRQWPGWCGVLSLLLGCVVGCRSGGEAPAASANAGEGGTTIPVADAGPGATAAPVKVDERLVAANTRFAFGLFDELLRQQAKQSIFVSPSSVAMALAMTYNGAAGETRKAMAAALKLGGMTVEQVNAANADLVASLKQAQPAVDLAIANSLWARKGEEFRPAFLAANERFYGAKVAVLDFADPGAPKTINAWVNEETRGKIASIVPERIDPLTILFLINATYFKGKWTDQFVPAQTRNAPFTLLDGSKKTVPMMSRTGRYAYLAAEGFQAISLPYGDERVSMCIFLPDEKTNLHKFCSRLTPENWEAWVGKLVKQEGYIALPRFKLAYEAELNDALKALGMAVAFDAQRADFGDMCTGSGVFIGNVKHKTFVDVNEEGTEAAAATSVEMMRTAMPVRQFRMIVDRPFFCAIRDNQTGTVLFMGAIVDPTSGSGQ